MTVWEQICSLHVQSHHILFLQQHKASKPQDLVTCSSSRRHSIRSFCSTQWSRWGAGCIPRLLKQKNSEQRQGPAFSSSCTARDSLYIAKLESFNPVLNKCSVCSSTTAHSFLSNTTPFNIKIKLMGKSTHTYKFYKIIYIIDTEKYSNKVCQKNKQANKQ